ncbi:MAG: hypothetical protein ACI8W7_001355, partial [Gammaproteobacteria bacterium]
TTSAHCVDAKKLSVALANHTNPLRPSELNRIRASFAAMAECSRQDRIRYCSLSITQHFDSPQ